MKNQVIKSERRNEIAMSILMHKLKKDGINLSEGTHREIENTAKQIGISKEEVADFAEFITRKLVDEIFRK